MHKYNIGLIVYWLVFINNGNNTVNVILAIVFVLGRVLHTICYLKELMPWRTVAFGMGFFSTLANLGNLLYGTFR